MVDGLTYFNDLNKEIRRANTTIVTEVKVDEKKIINDLANKMKRELNLRTTESIGI